MLQFKHQIEAHERPITAAAFDPVAQRLLTSDGAEISAWGVVAGGALQTRGSVPVGHNGRGRLISLLALPELQLFLAVTADEQDQLGAQLLSFAGHGGGGPGGGSGGGGGGGGGGAGGGPDGGALLVEQHVSFDRAPSSTVRGEGFKTLPRIECSCAAVREATHELLTADASGGLWMWAVRRRAADGHSAVAPARFRVPLRLRIRDGGGVGPSALAVDEAAGRIYAAVGCELRAWDAESGARLLVAETALAHPARALAICPSTRRLMASWGLPHNAHAMTSGAGGKAAGGSSENGQRCRVWGLPPCGAPPAGTSLKLPRAHALVDDPAPDGAGTGNFVPRHAFSALAMLGGAAGDAAGTPFSCVCALEEQPARKSRAPGSPTRRGSPGRGSPSRGGHDEGSGGGGGGGGSGGGGGGTGAAVCCMSGGGSRRLAAWPGASASSPRWRTSCPRRARPRCRRRACRGSSSSSTGSTEVITAMATGARKGRARRGRAPPRPS